MVRSPPRGVCSVRPRLRSTIWRKKGIPRSYSTWEKQDHPHKTRILCVFSPLGEDDLILCVSENAIDYPFVPESQAGKSSLATLALGFLLISWAAPSLKLLSPSFPVCRLNMTALWAASGPWHRFSGCSSNALCHLIWSLGCSHSLSESMTSKSCCRVFIPLLSSRSIYPAIYWRGFFFFFFCRKESCF